MIEAIGMGCVLTVLVCIAVMARSKPENDRLIQVLDELIEAKKEIIRLKQESGKQR